MLFYTKSSEETIKELHSDSYHGLSSDEIPKRAEKYGRNELTQKKNKSLFLKFLAQLNEPMIYILFAAALISAILKEFSDTVIILIVVLLNAVIGVVQESKAEKALDALKQLSSPKALVKRDGIVCEVNSADLVVGDIVLLEAGRYVPADLRLTEAVNLQIEESALTGESVPVNKDNEFVAPDEKTVLGDRKNMAYMSTYVTNGRGAGVVSETGMNTQIGKIAKSLDEAEEEATPLQVKLAQLGKTLGFLALGVCALIFVISIIEGKNIFDMLLTSISLAVAAIPEGLPAVVTIVLALGVQKMSKRKAIIRKLPAVETLGCVNVVCSDKTGTLTKNKMTVTKFYQNGSLESIDQMDAKTNEMLLHGMALCNDSDISGENEIGDPTETALLVMGSRVGLTKEGLNREHPRVFELPFDSGRKMMTTVHTYGDKKLSFTKGATDNILTRTVHILENGKVRPITEEDKSALMNAMTAMSNEALRVLALAYKEVSEIDGETLESGLTFVGLVGMIDPPREEVKDAIHICHKAGIRTVMITGDHKDTAFAIARELDITQDKKQVLSGRELDEMSDEQLKKTVENTCVFARVSPEHKVRIVKAFKANGNIVSMTGDGVNDAPSLKNADIGVAMGITGTDVSKGAADMVLSDDNFTTIVGAIEEGRNIYANIKRTVLFLLSCNLGEIFTLLVAIVLNFTVMPLRPIHILWVNLITDTLPALSLGVEPGFRGIMNRKPRPKDESLFAHGGWFFIILNGILVGGVTLAGFQMGEGESHQQTIAFMVLAISQLFFSLSVRNIHTPIYKIGIFKNKALWGSILLGVLLQFLVTTPILSGAFETATLSGMEWLSIFLLSLAPFVINEIVKFVRLGFDKKK